MDCLATRLEIQTLPAQTPPCSRTTLWAARTKTRAGVNSTSLPALDGCDHAFQTFRPDRRSALGLDVSQVLALLRASGGHAGVMGKDQRQQAQERESLKRTAFERLGQVVSDSAAYQEETRA